MGFNAYTFYLAVGPWATPAPAAMAAAARTYTELQPTFGREVAWIAAIISLVSLEAAGGICTVQMIQASSDKKSGWFWVCVLGVVVYMVLGIYSLMGYTAWVYVVLAVFVHIGCSSDVVRNKARQEQAEADQHQDREREHAEAMAKFAVEIERQKTNQANAEVRRRKAEQPVVLGVPSGGVRTNSSNIRTEQVERIFAFLDANPEASVSQIEAAVGCARSTASTQRANWKKTRNTPDEVHSQSGGDTGLSESQL